MFSLFSFLKVSVLRLALSHVSSNLWQTQPQHWQSAAVPWQATNQSIHSPPEKPSIEKPLHPKNLTSSFSKSFIASGKQGGGATVFREGRDIVTTET
jgi:hypothetical protein